MNEWKLDPAELDSIMKKRLAHSLLAFEFGRIIQENPEIVFTIAAGNIKKDSTYYALRNADIKHNVMHFYSAFSYPNQIIVAAVNDQNQLASFSAFGKKSVHLAALGEAVEVLKPKGGRTKLDGTSFAAPAVAFKIANLISQKPGLTVEDAVAALKKEVVPDR